MKKTGINSKLSEGLLKEALEDLPEIPSGIRLQYKEPESFTELGMRKDIAAFFRLVCDVFDTDWNQICQSINDRDIDNADEYAKVEPLPDQPYSKKIKLKTDDVNCTESCVVSKDYLGYSLAFQYCKKASENFAIEITFERSSRTLYITTSADDPSSASYYGTTSVLMPLLWENRVTSSLVPETIDGISKPIFLPDTLSEKEAKEKIDSILSGDERIEIPYAFFTKMYGFSYPLSHVAVYDTHDDIASHLIALNGIAHPVMIENRDLAAYITNALRKLNGLRLPSAESGFALLAWPNCRDARVWKPTDCINPDSGDVEPLELRVAMDAVEMVTLSHMHDHHVTMNDVMKAAKAEQAAKEEEIKKSDLYQALLAENEKLKRDLKAKAVPAPAPNASEKKALEDKCETLRVANGNLKLRIDSLEAKNKELRERNNTDPVGISLNTDGITEMYDNEVYLQIMALLSDELPNLKTAGATRRAEIVEGLLKANSYNDEIEAIHRDLVAAAKTGRKDDLFAVLSEYNISIDDKEHPAFRFNGESGARDNMSGTPSDIHSRVNAAKHIGKVFF